MSYLLAQQMAALQGQLYAPVHIDGTGTGTWVGNSLANPCKSSCALLRTFLRTLTCTEGGAIHIVSEEAQPIAHNKHMHIPCRLNPTRLATCVLGPLLAQAVRAALQPSGKSAGPGPAHTL